MRSTRFWGKVALVAAAATMLAACTSGDDDDAAERTTTTAGAPTEEAPEVTGPAPGVTDDTIEVGVAYVDTDALASVGLDFVTGHYVAVYQVLADDINENGGIFGRQLALAFAPIDPTSPSPAEEPCVRLTEDEDVFVVVGFFLTDAVICEVTTHQTAVVGGDMTPERLEQALAPWVSWTYDTDLPVSALHTYDERGALDGTVAVFANSRDQGVLDNQVLPTLEELGVVNSSTTDTSILEGSLATGRFGPNQAVFETEAMQECAGRLADRGVDTPSPESVGDDDPQNMPSPPPSLHAPTSRCCRPGSRRPARTSTTGRSMRRSMRASRSPSPAIPPRATSDRRPTPTATRRRTSSSGTPPPRTT